jgi:hypothetical protein
MALMLLCLAGACDAQNAPAPGRRWESKTFSIELPQEWGLASSGETNPDFQFEGPNDITFEVALGKASENPSPADALKALTSVIVLSDGKTTPLTQWSKFSGLGEEMEGTMNPQAQPPIKARIIIFVFRHGDDMYIITEIAHMDDYEKYAADYKTLEQSFELK